MRLTKSLLAQPCAKPEKHKGETELENEKNTSAVASDTTQVRTAQTFESLQPGTIVQNIGSGNSYVITENFGQYAIAVRTICVQNLNEWKIVDKAEKPMYSMCAVCKTEIGFNGLSKRWEHTRGNWMHPAMPTKGV